MTLHDAEHDRYEWVSLETALARCLPEQLAQSIARSRSFCSIDLEAL